MRRRLAARLRKRRGLRKCRRGLHDWGGASWNLGGKCGHDLICYWCHAVSKSEVVRTPEAIKEDVA